MKLLRKIWAKEWVKIMTPVYGELYIMRQPMGGHAEGYEQGMLMFIIGLGKYGFWAALIWLVVAACR